MILVRSDYSYPSRCLWLELANHSQCIIHTQVVLGGNVFISATMYYSAGGIQDLMNFKQTCLLLSPGMNKPAMSSAIRDLGHLTESVPRKNSMELRNETQAATACEGMALINSLCSHETKITP